MLKRMQSGIVTYRKTTPLSPSKRKSLITRVLDVLRGAK